MFSKLRITLIYNLIYGKHRIFSKEYRTKVIFVKNSCPRHDLSHLLGKFSFPTT